MKKKLDEMFPREIVEALDEYIIGQKEAKKMGMRIILLYQYPNSCSFWWYAQHFSLWVPICWWITAF